MVTRTVRPATASEGAVFRIYQGQSIVVLRRLRPVISDGYGRRIEATESRYVAGRYGLDIQFDVELPDDDATPSPV